jgi:hypothetical protein
VGEGKEREEGGLDARVEKQERYESAPYFSLFVAVRQLPAGQDSPAEPTTPALSRFSSALGAGKCIPQSWHIVFDIRLVELYRTGIP